MTASNDRCTVDGVPVKLGDRVWYWRGYGSPRLRKLDKTDLGMWWDWMGKRLYSTERAALDAAIAEERQALKKAKSQARTATKAIERLTKQRENMAETELKERP